MRDYLANVLVTGGRDYADEKRVWAALDTIHLLYGDIMLIHGGAKGVDTFAENWAKDHQQVHICFPAEWNKYGKRAGSKRNAEMAAIGLSENSLNHALVFRGGRGTTNMLSILRNFKVLEEYHINLWLVDGEFWK